MTIPTTRRIAAAALAAMLTLGVAGTSLADDDHDHDHDHSHDHDHDHGSMTTAANTSPTFTG